MSNESMQQLLALRAQLQQLELEEAAKAKVSEQPAADDSAKGIGEGLIPEDLKGWLGELEGLDGEQLLARIRDEADRWLGEVDADLKDANPSTLLLVFGLGVLVGRLSQ
jgi:hypothetical protein